MRKANKEKKKLELTKEDLYTVDEKSPLYSFNRMCYTPVYEFRIRKYLYEKDKLSPKGFLFNADILSLPNIAKKNKKGEILLDVYISSLVTRYELAQKIFDTKNELLALLIDMDDALYAEMLKFKDSKDIFKEESVGIEVSKAYDRLVDVNLNFEINNYILNDKKLDSLVSFIDEDLLKTKN